MSVSRSRHKVGFKLLVSLLGLGLCASLGCDSNDDGGGSSPLDGSFSRLDAGHDAGALDSALPPIDAAPTARCYSPVDPPPREVPAAPRGCECPYTDGRWLMYCINGYAVTCVPDQGWGFGIDGNCAPKPIPVPVGNCEANGGVSVPHVADCSGECPSGFNTDRGYDCSFVPDGGADATDCCVRLEVTAKNCTQAGLMVLPEGSQSSLLETRCSNGGALRGFVSGQAVPSLCCAAP